MIRPVKSILHILILTLAALSVLTGCAAPALNPGAPTSPAETATLPPAGSPVPFETIAPPPSPTPEPTLAPTQPIADLAVFKNLAYRIPSLLQAFPETGGVFQLKDGAFDQPIPDSSARLHIELLNGAHGDLNGDGVQDGVVVLLVDSGGSGNFRYLATLLNRDGALVNNATTFLGDRVQVDNIAIDGNTIRLALTTHAPSDPQCCPTLQGNADYVLIDNLLAPSDLAQVAAQAVKGVQALRDKDMQALASLAHPTEGIRFSPYAYVRQEDLVFTPEQVSNLMDDATIYNWGYFDGSGEPIQMAYPEYHERFVYSRDFANADQVSFNQRIGMGNSLDNSQDFYPNSVVVEFYSAPQDPQFGGLDWQSLRLVMVPDGSGWYIIGIIHDEWTT
jgi:hypothetical protein